MNIIGKSECTAEQMAQYLIDRNPNAKSWALEYAKLYIEEGEAEGVRGDGAWIQSCKETGNFKFINTAVTFSQNNFCGLGVTSRGMKGCSFSTPRLGIRAQIQHLKGYATSSPLKNACIDPRYKYINPKGKAARFEDLAGKWAVPGYDTSKASSLEDAMSKGIGYGFDIINGINIMKKIVPDVVTEKYYRVQVGAFKSEANAKALQLKLRNAGFSSIIKQIDGLYKCQIGAFKNKSNAESMVLSIKTKGFDAFVIYQ